MKQFEIGSDFELNFRHMFGFRHEPDPGMFNNGAFHIFMARGRSSIRYILDHLMTIPVGTEVLLPAYLFKALLVPFKEKGLTLRFYKINHDMSADTQDIRLKLSSSTKILYLIHYFGFPQQTQHLTWIKNEFPRCVVIEDLAQALGTACLNKSLGTFGNFSFNNLIKFMAIPDGSILTLNNHSPFKPVFRIEITHISYTVIRYMAMLAKETYLKMQVFPKSIHRRLFRSADRLAEKHNFRCGMSRLSMWLLSKTDIGQLIHTRRRNYLHLLNNWHSQVLTPLFATLPDDVCPLGFIVLCDKRDYVVKTLAQQGIYCPSHWSPSAAQDTEAFAEEINQDDFPISWQIAKTIMMIPIDQRYTLQDMDRILNTISQLENPVE